MKTTEERIAELEQRVAYLEGIVNQSENIELKSLNINDSSLIHIEDSAEYHTENASKEMDSVQNSVFKDKEALLGRYIVGVLAAILIFVGAVSFVSLIWHRITPEGKVAIITLSGVALTALGFWLIRKNKNPVSSVILGMGAGLLFIAILSANMAFYLISNNTAIFLSGAWAIAFIMSSRYRDLFFTKIIAYIGSYITLILGLSLMSSNMELLVLTLFVTAISGVMFRTSKFNVKTDSVETDQPTIHMERILNIILSMFSYTTIFAGSMLKWGIDGYGIQLGILSVIYVLLNMLYKVYDIRRKKYPLYLLISLFVTMLTIWFMGYLRLNTSLTALHIDFLFFIINLAQLIVNIRLYKNIEATLTKYYTVILIFASIFINMELFDIPTGVVIVGLLLLVIEKVFDTKMNPLMIGWIVLLDALFFLIHMDETVLSSAYGLVQLGMFAYILWQCYCKKEYMNLNALKKMGVVLVMILSYAVPSNIIHRIGLSTVN